MNAKRFVLLLLTAGALTATGPIGAQQTKPGADLTVGQIVDRANYVSYYQGADGRARVHMQIVDSRKNVRERELTVLRWDAPDPAKAGDDGKVPTEQKARSRTTGDQKFFIYFHEPADVANQTFLFYKHVDKEDVRWMYLPGKDHVKRLAVSDNRRPFVGAHFFNEDVSGRNPADDTHELISTTDKYCKLKSVPKDASLVEFAWYVTWIDRKTFVVRQTSYYKPDGREYRRYNALKVETIQGHPTVTVSQMSDLVNREYTRMTYKKVEYDVGVPEDIFTERYMRKPPLGTWIK